MRNPPRLKNKEFYLDLLGIDHSNLVIDEKSRLYNPSTLHPLELTDLLKLTDNTFTSWGAETVEHTMFNPLTDINQIRAKQESLAEIDSNDKLKQRLFDFFEFAESHTNVEYKNDRGAWRENPIDQFLTSMGRENLKHLNTLVKRGSSILPSENEVESQYLKNLIGNVNALDNSQIQRFAKGVKFKQWFRNKAYNVRELKLSAPIPFLPIPAPSILTAGGYGAYETFNFLSSLGDPGFISIVAVTGILGATGGIAVEIDREFQKKIRNRFMGSEQFISAINSIGKLDELLSEEQMRADLVSKGLPVCLPKVTDSQKHYFKARGLINLVEKNAQDIDNYIPNDVNISGVTFYLGPNSGGKTSLAKAIGQAQVKAQGGGYIPASSGDIGIADQIFYQVGRNDNMADIEGGFGTQLKSTKKIFYRSTPKSLVIIDDLIEGTSFQDKTDISTDQLSGFTHIGNSVIYVSHHHELAQDFKNKGSGLFYQIEFDGENPTHKLIPGICTESQAQRVANNMRFGKENIRTHLVEKGYLAPDQDLRDLELRVQETA